MTNSAEPDQLASEANWSGSTLFAKTGYIRVQQDQGLTNQTLFKIIADNILKILIFHIKSPWNIKSYFLRKKIQKKDILLCFRHLSESRFLLGALH